jgi:thiol-disulfide isomerase/thioredoxin
VNWDDKDTEDRVKNLDQLRNEDDDDDEDDEDDDEEENREEKVIEELVKASKMDESVISAMSPEQREQLAVDLRRAAEAGKKARVTIVSPVPSSDFFSATNLPVKAAAVTDGDKAATDANAEEEVEGKQQVEDEEDQDQDDDKEKSGSRDDSSQPIERIRWMWETNTNQWEVYSQEISREIELARRDGQLECSLRIGDISVVCKIQGSGDGMSQESNGETQRLRRHYVKEGLEGQWEMMSLNYKPPFSLYGESALKILQKVWKGGETMNGKNCGLSFIFLYALFQGQMRCRVLTSGYSDWWKGDGGFGYGGYDGGKSYSSSSSSSDSHRLGLLLAQLYTDRSSKSVYASVINVLGRNKQLCVRMPEFKDTRKSRQSSIFNGWTDAREPRSAVGDLFNKIVPLLQNLKRSKQGSLVFPPKPPHPELPQPPPTCAVPPRRQNTYSPDLSDLDCSSRTLGLVSAEDVRALASAVKHQFGPSRDSGEPPLEVDDEIHAESLVAASPGTLFVLFFHATWCTPCSTLGPIVRKLAILTPAARFLRVDIDSCDVLALRLKVKSLPTIKFVRGGLKLAHVLESIDGIDEDFYAKFRSALASVYTQEERERMERIMSGQSEVDAKVENDKLSENVSRMLQAGENEVKDLTSRPLAMIATVVDENSRLGRGLAPIESKLSFDVSKHEAARTAVAQSMLQRMMDDVHAYAKIANELPNPKLTFLSEEMLRSFYSAEKEAEEKILGAIQALEKLMSQLQELRALDESAVNYSIALMTQSANYVDIAGGGYLGRRARTEFLLRRTAGQAAEIWPEFLFGSLISSKGELDITALNPYVPLERVDVILQLVILTMLRANRMGHISRCVGATIVLQKLMKRTLEKNSMETLLPMVLQGADDLADMLSSGRHYGTLLQSEGEALKVAFDPRFLIFEFAWNILLRQKQVEIVKDFVGHVKAGSSKVKQMIMGAGKTTVVAPLLALMLADSKSLVLSVVPKALLEMSRTQMRETFANIIPKRVYTFKFERATEVTPGMRLTLENAARNRGIVVATPTSLKSVMLVYIETLRMLDEAWHSSTGRPPSREAIDGWTRQAKELAGILNLFKDGVMLLDEVDLILHPLKSELNFPLGEKHALDCSDAGERWTLPIHILDSIFYSGFGRAAAFEARGVALDILRRIGNVLAEGYSVKALQRLPHVTLLNPQWYHASLKPVMAEWIYLWLQKQHLHGISRQETVTYILEGAVARSEATAKVACIDAALIKVESELGTRPPLTPSVRTPSHLASLAAEQRYLFEEESENARIEVSQAIQLQPERRHLLEIERKELELAKDASQRLVDLVHELYQLDEEVETAVQHGGKRIAACQEQIVLLQKKIQELESPRDDSFDNSTIVWASEIFTKTSSSEASRYGDEAVVLLACGKLEELGFTVRRCGTYDEAIERAWQLRASGQLRCVIAGGEAAKGCGRNCTKSHDQDGKCIVCGNSWAEHSGHTCSGGQQGSWIVKVRGGTAGPKGIDASKLTASLIEDVPSGLEPIPPSRVMLFAGGSASLREDKRLALWKSGISVTEDKAALLEWAEGQPSWSPEDEEDEGDAPSQRPPPALKREMSSGLQTLKSLRQQLIEVLGTPLHSFHTLFHILHTEMAGSLIRFQLFKDFL